MKESAADSSPDNSPRRLRRPPPPFIDMEAILDGLRARAIADGQIVRPRLNRDTGEWVGLEEGQEEPPLPDDITMEQLLALRQANREKLAKEAATDALSPIPHNLPSLPLFDFINDDYGGQGRQTPYVSADEEAQSEEPVIKSIKKIKPRHSLIDNAERAARVLSPIVRKQMKKRGADYDETWTLEADQMESDPEVYLDKVAVLAGNRAAQLKRGATERGDRAAKRAKKARRSQRGKGSVDANYSSSDSESKAREARRRRLPSKTPLQLAPPAPRKKSDDIPVNPKIGRIIALDFARLSQLDEGDRAHYERGPRTKIKAVDPKKTSTGRFLGRIEDTAFAVTVQKKPRKMVSEMGKKPITKLVREDVIVNLPEKDRGKSTNKGKAVIVSKGRSSIPQLDLAPAEEVLGIIINKSHSVDPRPQVVVPRKKLPTIKKRVHPPSSKGKSKLPGFRDTIFEAPLPALDIVVPTARSSPSDDNPVETPSRIPLAKNKRHPTNISNVTLTPPSSPVAQSLHSVPRVSPASTPRERSRESTIEIEDDPIALELERIRRLPTPVSRFRFGPGTKMKRAKPRLSLVKRKESLLVEEDEYFSPPPPPNQQRRPSTPEFDQPFDAADVLASDSDDEEEKNRVHTHPQQKDAIFNPPASILRSTHRRASSSAALKRHVSFSSPTYFQQQSRIPLRSKTVTTPVRAPVAGGAALMRSRTVAGQSITLDFLAEREQKRQNPGGSSGRKMRRRMSIPAFSLPEAEDEMIIEQAASIEEQGGGEEVHFSAYEFDIRLSDSDSPTPLVKGKNRHITISPSPLPFPVAGQNLDFDLDVNLSLSPYYPTPSPHHSPLPHSVAKSIEQKTLSRIIENPNQIFSLPSSFHAGSGEVRIVARSITIGHAGGGGMEWV